MLPIVQMHLFIQQVFRIQQLLKRQVPALGAFILAGEISHRGVSAWIRCGGHEPGSSSASK